MTEGSQSKDDVRAAAPQIESYDPRDFDRRITKLEVRIKVYATVAYAVLGGIAIGVVIALLLKFL